MGILGKKALFEPIRSIDSATFTGTYQAVGTVLTNPAVLLKVVNNSTVLVTISFNGGVNDQDIIPGGGFTLYDFGSDAQSVSGNERLSMPAGTQIMVKGAVATGLVYVIAVYAGLMSQAGINSLQNITVINLTVTGLANFLGGVAFHVTTPGAYPYTVLVTDYTILVNTTAARTINLPNTTTSGQVFVIKDATGTAGANNISVTTPGGVVTIDGVTTYTMNVNRGSITVQFDGTNYQVI